MYAILQQSGHQYRVSPGDRLLVDRLAAEVGSMVALEPVVLVQGDNGTQVGTPVVDGVRVAAIVVGHPKGGKLRVFKYKAKKRYRRTHGHRSLLTELRVEAVLAAGEKLPEPKAAAAVAEPAAAPAKGRGRARAKAVEAVAELEAAVAEALAEQETAAAVAEPETVDAVAAAEPEAAAEAPAPKRRSRAKKAPAESTETDTDAPATGGETEA